MPSDLEDAAIDYVDACIGAEGAEGDNLMGALSHRTEMLHQLIARTGRRCPMCDPPCQLEEMSRLAAEEFDWWRGDTKALAVDKEKP